MRNFRVTVTKDNPPSEWRWQGSLQPKMCWSKMSQVLRWRGETRGETRLCSTSTSPCPPLLPQGTSHSRGNRPYYWPIRKTSVMVEDAERKTSENAERTVLERSQGAYELLVPEYDSVQTGLGGALRSHIFIRWYVSGMTTCSIGCLDQWTLQLPLLGTHCVRDQGLAIFSLERARE